jgi:hypothetical protein
MKNAINTFIPYSKDYEKASNIAYLIREWESKNTEYEKRGSFNVELYLDYLAVINEQPTK